MMNNFMAISIIYIIGLVLYAAEYYFVSKKGINKWIIPISVWSVSLIVAIPFSGSMGLFPSLMQIVCLLVFEIENHFRKNSDIDRMKIKNL